MSRSPTLPSSLTLPEGDTVPESETVAESPDAPLVDDDEVLDALGSSEEEDDDDNNDYQQSESDSDSDDGGPSALGPSKLRGITKKIQKRTAIVSKGKGIRMKPAIKPGAYHKQRKFERDVKQLAAAELGDIFQFEPFRRMMRDALTYEVTQVSTAAVMTMMEASLSYVHELYMDSYAIAVKSSKRQTLMMRDVMGAVQAKRNSIVCAPPEMA